MERSIPEEKGGLKQNIDYIYIYLYYYFIFIIIYNYVIGKQIINNRESKNKEHDKERKKLLRVFI